ncbi:hypothetical protein Tco_0806604 [Tanacetum coccineum]
MDYRPSSPPYTPNHNGVSDRRIQEKPTMYGSIHDESKQSLRIIAGYLTDADDLKSQIGYVFVLNGGVVDWKSAKQSIFATSSAEAEYITACL